MLSTCTASEKHIFRRNSFARIRVFSSPFSFFNVLSVHEKNFCKAITSTRTRQRNIYLPSANIQYIYIYSSIVCQCNNIIKSVRRSKKRADPIPARSTVCSRVCFAATFSTDPSYIACIYIYVAFPFPDSTGNESSSIKLRWIHDGSS